MPPDQSRAAPFAAQKKLAVVIPVLNEARGLDALLGRLLPVLDKTGMDFEVIFVDDGSIDDTVAVLKAYRVREPRIKVVSLSRRFGKEIAVAAGLRYAIADAVILMDGDLQHPPELIPDLITEWQQGYDMVYGQRIDRRTDGPVRSMLATAFYSAFRILSGTQLPANVSDFRILSRRAVSALNQLSERARFNRGLFAWIGFRSHGVPFEVPERSYGGKSRWRPRALLHFALDGLTSFSTIPLRVWSYLGLLISLAAFAYALGFLVKTLMYGTDLAGFPTLIVSIMFFSGVQLISLGVLGEYMGRIYDEVKARPLFLVADEIGFDPQEKPQSANPVPSNAAGARI